MYWYFIQAPNASIVVFTVFCLIVVRIFSRFSIFYGSRAPGLLFILVKSSFFPSHGAFFLPSSFSYLIPYIVFQIFSLCLFWMMMCTHIYLLCSVAEMLFSFMNLLLNFTICALDQANFKPPNAIRGGIPICFPQVCIFHVQGTHLSWGNMDII